MSPWWNNLSVLETEQGGNLLKIKKENFCFKAICVGFLVIYVFQNDCVSHVCLSCNICRKLKFMYLWRINLCEAPAGGWASRDVLQRLENSNGDKYFLRENCFFAHNCVPWINIYFGGNYLFLRPIIFWGKISVQGVNLLFNANV